MLQTIVGLTSLTMVLTSALAPEQQALDRMQSLYGKGGNLEAGFRQVYIDKLRGKKRQETGHLWASADGKVRWSYQQPQRKDFIYDGKTAYFYEPENAQVTVFDSFENSQMATAMQFLWGRGQVASRFTTKPCQALCDAKADAKDTVVELTPKEPIPTVKQLALVIGSDGRIRKTVVLDPLGNRTEYQFDDVKFGIRVDPVKFNFTPPDGVSILRANVDSPKP